MINFTFLTCEKLESYLQNVIKDDFLKNEILHYRRSLEKPFRRIKRRNPQIPWREMMRMRDKIVHHYFRLILDVIWQTATEDIPALKTEIKKVLDSFPEEN